MTRQSELEIRKASEVRSQGRTLTGYVAKFNSETRIGRYREIIAPGAFTDSLNSGADILALADHDTNAVIGRSKSGTLTLTEDSEGLAFTLNVPNTTRGNDILELAQRNDLGGMSFGFRVRENGDTWDGDLRTLRNVDLFEVSVVSAHPAYGETSISVRSKPRLYVHTGNDWLDTV